MALPLYDVNYVAIIVCLVIHMALGYLWYSNFLFGAPWRKLMGISDSQMRKGQEEDMLKPMLIATIAGFVLIFMLAQTIKAPDVNTLFESAEMSFWIWLGFIATVMTGSVLWEGKSWTLYLINSGYYLLSMIISGIILYVWI